ncbi:MAG: Hsp20/alpha crystallin family protein [Candidatus Marinimicrobia bacterium]|nr:Hsp20/alpha crystallin family protein [Candidatus Neomarinimicrobiota bacterium]
MKHLVRRERENEFYPSTLSNFFNENFVASYKPRMNLIETDGNYKVEVEAPGIKKENINILFEDDVLTISGEKMTGIKEENSRYHINEISFGKFSRSFELPNHIDNEKITAKWNDGILNIEIPKSAKAKPKKIEIN